MHRRCGAGECRCESPVSVLHDGLFLVTFPDLEHLDHGRDVEVGMVGEVYEMLGVVAVEVDFFVRRFEKAVAVVPWLAIGNHGAFVRQIDAPNDHVASDPRLSVERVLLILHAEVQQSRVLLPSHPLEKPVGPQRDWRSQVHLQRRNHRFGNDLSTLVACPRASGQPGGDTTLRPTLIRDVPALRSQWLDRIERCQRKS